MRPNQLRPRCFLHIRIPEQVEVFEQRDVACLARGCAEEQPISLNLG